MKFKINETLSDDDKLRELNNVEFNYNNNNNNNNNNEILNKNTFEKTKDNGDKIKFIFNDSIKIWQMWEVNRGDNNFNYIWIANQANQDYIFKSNPLIGYFLLLIRKHELNMISLNFLIGIIKIKI